MSTVNITKGMLKDSPWEKKILRSLVTQKDIDAIARTDALKEDLIMAAAYSLDIPIENFKSNYDYRFEQADSEFDITFEKKGKR